MEYFNSIYDIAVAQIEKDLTIGYIEHGLCPLTPFEIVAFIEKNKDNITQAVKTLINDYARDEDTIEFLANPTASMVREYLYDYVNELHLSIAEYNK